MRMKARFPTTPLTERVPFFLMFSFNKETPQYKENKGTKNKNVVSGCLNTLVGARTYAAPHIRSLNVYRVRRPRSDAGSSTPSLTPHAWAVLVSTLAMDTLMC